MTASASLATDHLHAELGTDPYVYDVTNAQTDEFVGRLSRDAWLSWHAYDSTDVHVGDQFGYLISRFALAALAESYRKAST
jgi:hypothetical protein